MKIAIVGAGYVGLANAILLAQYNEVVILDISPQKIQILNQRKSPIPDAEIEYYIANKHLNIKATSNPKEAYENASFVIICTPTDYDEKTYQLNTKSIESVISDALSIDPRATIVIKSTVPIGYTQQLRETLSNIYQHPVNLIFCPEFLREGKALYDNLYPSRIIIGDQGERGKVLSCLLTQAALKQEIPTLFTSSTEAEAIKLFSNSYLALRVAYFNELDTYAASHALDARRIIQGVCLDPRIGDYYNNPSFGYGGYCLPKDTQQLLANYQEIPQNLIHTTIESNKTRQDFIAHEIIKKNPKIVGIHRLAAKSKSGNIRSPSILHIIKKLQYFGIETIIYEPAIKENSYSQSTIINDLAVFKNKSDIILSNRMSPELNDVKVKVYTRDIFGTD